MIEELIMAALMALNGYVFSMPGGVHFMRAQSPVASAQRAAEATIPLGGADPVLLVAGREEQGDEKFSVTRGRFRYLFASAENKTAFERDPARYEIQLGGTCARMGPAVQGNPDLFHVHRGRIYIFGSVECVKAFKAAPENYLETNAADAAGAPVSPESLKGGRALVERAVEALGGAAKVDALVSYQEKATTATHTANGTAEVKTSTVYVFPDRVRYERALSFGTIATVLTPGESFFLAPRQAAAPMLDEQRAAFEKQFRRNLLSILRARREGIFTAVGAGKAGEARVEQVDVKLAGFTARLGVDPATGRVLSLAYRGRGPGGVFGGIVQTFSDFRAAGGLTLPFKTEGSFNGQPEPSLSSSVESITLNGEVPPSLFEKPKPEGAGR